MVFIYTKIDNINLYYEVIGEGYPILLLHGWGANCYTFEKLANNLSDNFKVYSLDLPGFGNTEIGLPYNNFEVAEIIHKFVEINEINNPIILGHSYGGRIAIIYASKYKVKKLILVSSAGVKQKLSFKKKLNVKVYKLLKKCHIKVNMGSKDYLNADNVKRKMLVDSVNLDLVEYMKNIDTETLLIYGKNDTTTPIDMAKIIEENIKNSALVEMEDCNHFPYLEQPTIFNLIINSFLSDLGD